MSKMMRWGPARTVLSVWAWLALGISVITIVPIVAVIRLVTARSDPGRYRAGHMFRQIAVMHQKLNPLWKFTVSGRMPDDPRNPYVVVANHESFVDILLLSHLPFEMKWMSKSDFFKFPLVGWGMRLAGDIRLERNDLKSGVKALDECGDRLDKKVSVMIFPEGTRSATGELQEFKDGAFRLAISKQVPILPVAVIGTRDALIKHDWRFGHSQAEARVLDPIPTEGMTRRDVKQLRERTRAAIAEALETMRAERAAAA